MFPQPPNKRLTLALLSSVPPPLGVSIIALPQLKCHVHVPGGRMPTAHWLLWRGLLVLVSASVVSALHARPAATQQMEDVGYLKDGGIVRGTIIEQRPGESLRIQASDGNVFRYAMDQIERIAKEPIPAA